MAEENTTAEVAAAAGKGGGMMKVGLILAAIFVVEIGAIFLYMNYISPDPKALTQDGGSDDGEKKPGLGLHHLEMVIVEGKYENTVSGQRVLYDVKVVAKVSKKNGEKDRFETDDDLKKFQEDMKGLDSEFGDAIAGIIRRENPTNLRDDHDLTYLSNKIRDRLNKIIKDNSEMDDDLINKVLIPKLIELQRS